MNQIFPILLCTLTTSLCHLYDCPVYMREPEVLAKVQHSRRSGMGEEQNVQYCLSELSGQDYTFADEQTIVFHV